MRVFGLARGVGVVYKRQDYFMWGKGGSFVFVTACIRSGLGGFVHTAAARGGVTAMMRTPAYEWAEFGIPLNLALLHL